MKVDITQIQDCFKEIFHFGSITYVNICTGTEKNVPWGFGDWIGYLMLYGICAFVVVLIFFFIIKIVSEGL